MQPGGFAGEILRNECRRRIFKGLKARAASLPPSCKQMEKEKSRCRCLEGEICRGTSHKLGRELGVGTERKEGQQASQLWLRFQESL